jgi:hypothetical protein
MFWIVLSTCEAQAPDDDHRTAVLVQIGRGGEDALVVGLEMKIQLGIRMPCSLGDPSKDKEDEARTICNQSSMIPIPAPKTCSLALPFPCPLSHLPLTSLLKLTSFHLISRNSTDIPHHRPHPSLLLRTLSHQPSDLIPLPPHRVVSLVDLAQEPLEEDTRHVVLAHPPEVAADS